nr:serine/threonine protein kinase [Deltaproteobacteria bacterium]
MSDPEPARADDVQASPRGDGLTPLTEVCEGRYVLLAELARGDLSVVYRAKPKGSREAIAFKVLQPRLLGDEAQVRRFRREAEILRRIEHPNIVRLVDHGSIEDGRDFIALELLPGHTLADALAEGTRMEPERVCRICRQITRALRAMHQAGVIHRDLQPANIVLIGPEDGERVKLVDFSDAGDVGAPARRVRRSGKRRSTGNVLDVPSYRPPEQLRKRPPHPSMDIYALGVMMYEMLAGEHPFAQSDELAPPRMGPHTIRSKVFDAPEELLGLIVDCIEQSPEQRPVSTTAVLERLDKALLWIGVVPHDVEAEVGDEDARTQQWPAADPG